MMGKLEGKIAVISGATSGISLAIQTLRRRRRLRFHRGPASGTARKGSQGNRLELFVDGGTAQV
jgi:hypothetical protein